MIGLLSGRKGKGVEITLATSLALATVLSGCSSGSRGSGSAASTAGGVSVSAGTVQSASSLLTARVGHSAIRLSNGDVLISGGRITANAVANTAEVWSAQTGAVTPVSSLMSSSRMNHEAVLLRTGRVLLIGGQSDVTGSQPLATTEIYDPLTNSFTRGPNLTAPRSKPAVEEYNRGSTSFVLIAGGANAQARSVNTVDILNVDANVISASAGIMFEERFGGDAVRMANGRVAVIGGWSGTVSSNNFNARASGAEIFDPNTETFFPVAMQLARADGAVNSSAANEPIVFGGRSAAGVRADAEYFDGQTFLAVTAPMIAAREKATSLKLSSGEIFIIGGSNGQGALASTEAFQVPASSATSAGAFSAGPNLQVARRSASATELQSGAVLITGGEDASGNPIAAIEAWVPNGVSVPKPNTGTIGSGTTVPGLNPPAIITLNPNSGATGAQVSISGTGFSATPSANIVKFNGVVAPVTSVDLSNPTAQVIRTVVPNGATTGPVTVEVAGRVSTQNPVFTVSTSGSGSSGSGSGRPPRILIVIPNSGRPFFPVSITGSDFGNGAVARFNGVPTINVISFNSRALPIIGSVSEIVCLVPPGASSGPLTVENNGLISNPFFFTVN